MKSFHEIVHLEKREHPRFSVDLPVEYWKTYNPLSQPSRSIRLSRGYSVPGLISYPCRRNSVRIHCPCTASAPAWCRMCSFQKLSKISRLTPFILSVLIYGYRLDNRNGYSHFVKSPRRRICYARRGGKSKLPRAIWRRARLRGVWRCWGRWGGSPGSGGAKE